MISTHGLGTPAEGTVRHLAKKVGCKIQKSRNGDGTWQIIDSRTNTVWKAKGRDSFGLSLKTVEAWLVEHYPVEARDGRLGKAQRRVRESHPLRAELDKVMAKYGGSFKDWTVLSQHTDPFRMDTDTFNTEGQWLKDTIDRLGIVKIHNRGLHYAVLSAGVIKPNGERYSNTNKDWAWLQLVSKAARWLGYIEFDRITDERNADGIFRILQPVEPLGSIACSLDVFVPDADDCQPTVQLNGFTGTQPYRLAFIGEKSSLFDVLDPIARRYGADLVLFSGNASNTRLYELAKAAAEDGRPLVVLYFSDCDPWGWNMGIECAWKLQAFKYQQFPDLECRVYRAALTPDQVREYDLPETPIEKGSEQKAQDWLDAMGVEQTEIDAIATLQPELLAQITEESIAHFRDDRLDDEAQRVADGWRDEAQKVVDDEIDQDGLDDAVENIDRLRGEIQRVVDDRVQPIIDAAGDIELPELPDIPEPVVDPDNEPEPMSDSQWSFERMCRRLQADKRFEL